MPQRKHEKPLPGRPSCCSRERWITRRAMTSSATTLYRYLSRGRCRCGLTSRARLHRLRRHDEANARLTPAANVLTGGPDLDIDLANVRKDFPALHQQVYGKPL